MTILGMLYNGGFFTPGDYYLSFSGALGNAEIRFIGNSSLSGAYAMLISDGAAQKTAELGRNMSYIELSNEPGYMDEFVAACFLPHTNAALFPTQED